MKNLQNRITITKLLGFPFYCLFKGLFYLGPLFGWGTVYIWTKRGEYRSLWDKGEGWPTTCLWDISLFFFPILALTAFPLLFGEWSINGQITRMPLVVKLWAINELVAFISYFIIKAWLSWSKTYDAKFFNKEETF